MTSSEIEVVGLLQSAVRSTARKLLVEDVEWKTIDELMGEIRRDHVTYTYLKAFVDACTEWFSFHQQVDKAGGRPSPEQKGRLARLAQRRDETRAQILGRLRDRDKPSARSDVRPLII